MKAQEKDKKTKVEKMFGLDLTLNEDLNKYLAPEYNPRKLEKIESKFSKQSELRFKNPVAQH